MARIQLKNISLVYSDSQREPANRLFKNREERVQEDLPVQAGTGVKALDKINLTVPNGQTFVILGSSGSGKSTLLRVVAGLATHYTGQVFYDGQDMENIPPRERYIGMVFPNYALYPSFSNEGNLSFFFKMHQIPDEETRERIRYTSELMGIGFNELLPRKPGTLSGGEQQRVAIARAIVRRPRLFLFDEPLSHLDARLRVQTRSEIKRLLHRFEITAIYVTHDQVEAVALADQIVVMHAGKIEQIGTYQHLIENPVNLFVAGFVGLPPMNLFPGGFISGDKLVLDDYLIPLPRLILSLVEHGQPVTLGIRQEAVIVSTVSLPGDGIQLRGEVDGMESDFVHRMQTVHIRSGRFRYLGLCSLDVNLGIGQQVYISLDPGRLHFFDTTSGLRL